MSTFLDIPSAAHFSSSDSSVETKTPERNLLDSRLANWGRWSRRRVVAGRITWFNGETPDEADANLIERAVKRLDGTQHAAILRAWHQGLAHKSRISARLKIPLRGVRQEYLRARGALLQSLARCEAAPSTLQPALTPVPQLGGASQK